MYAYASYSPYEFLEWLFSWVTQIPFILTVLSFSPWLCFKCPLTGGAAKCPLYRVAALAKLGAASRCCLFSTESREHRIASGPVVKGRHCWCQHSGCLCWGCGSRSPPQPSPSPCCMALVMAAGAPVVPAVLSSGSGLLQSASLLWDDGPEMSVGW